MLNIFRNYFLQLVDKSARQNEANILSFVEDTPDQVGIDLGCDDGEWTMKIATKAKALQMYGIEIVHDRARIATEKGIKVTEGDLNNVLDYPDNFFDFVHSNQVIEHLKDTDKFVSEIFRILKPGGYAIFSTENLASTHNIFALLFGYQPFSMTNFSIKGNIGNPLALWNNETSTKSMELSSWQHNRLFSIRGLQDLLSKHGFVVEGTKTAGYYPLAGFISNIDPTHGHWLTVKVRK